MFDYPLRTGKAPVAEGLSLYYEDAGDEEAPVMLMIMGLGAQLTVWPRALREALLAKGFRVVCFDNRDVGLSDSTPNLPPIQTMANFIRSKVGRPIDAAYSLTDMVNDVVALMDFLNIPKAHVAGASMGGMIAQLLATHHPQRVLSLGVIMSNTNEPYLPMPSLRILMHLTGITGERVVDVPSAIRNRIAFWKRIRSSDDYADSESEVAKRAAASFERAFRPQGAARQSEAVMATGGFAAQLSKIIAPTIVIHGNADKLVPLAGGRDSARAIPSAQLAIIDGMGHDLPMKLCQTYADLITKNTQRPLGINEI